MTALPTTPQATTPQGLVDSVLAIATEAQKAFAATYEDFDWRADLGDDPCFWFEREPPAEFRPHVVGSTSERLGTWLWAWQNVNGFPADLVATAGAVRGWAQQHDVPELLVPEVPTHGADGTPVATRHVLLAEAVSGIYTHYRAPYGAGTHVWFLLDAPQEFALPPATALSTATALTAAAATGLVEDGVTAVAGYAARRDGVELLEQEAHRLLLGTTTDRVEVQIDELGRIAHIATDPGAGGAPHAGVREDVPPGAPVGLLGRLLPGLRRRGGA
ncbi:DUF6882 domain-containing protein [Cellulomonas shaoxiangyii]|uniref:Uncharacterized protein n=1 Tax=Cellulomonas shaoxiangyii TaxID=2566013 RepID=A0A4P7SH85_9CELL|nr:DUF6882 domain-containing protein [Cellulomonas shaoxiangyii]QCB93028.1 hypothetical protein E5225_05105 [Cellulomonas shaoxiangyii]TGY85556.1 hypothetical protein E5226_05850 [Cellulomonas shaoxiangyii]